MLDIKDIKKILNENIIPVLKVSNSFYGHIKRSASAPEFYPGYTLACEYAERVRIHAEVGKFKDAEKLFQANAPNETELEISYVKANYKQTTLPVYLDFHSTMMGMFADNDWYMEFTPEEEEKFKEQSMQQYIETGIKVFGSLENYFKSALVHLREVDANGLLCVKPCKMVKQTEEGDEDITELELYEPQPYYYRIDQVVSKSYDEYFLVMLDEKSIVKIGDRSDKSGYVFELYDDENIWKITQTGKAEDFKFTYEIYFNHAEGVIPAKELGGEPQIIADYIVWQPKFLYACDLLDISLVLNQYLRACHANVCFPYRVMLGNRCAAEYTDKEGQSNYCNKGKVYDSVIGQTIDCPSCKGFGLLDRVSRTGQMLIEPDGNLSKGDSPQMVANAMYYVGPDVAPLQLTKDLEEDAKNQARALMHLKTSSSKVQPNAQGDTAIGDTLDQKARTRFVLTESFQVFTLMQWSTDRIGWQRYAEHYVPVFFKYPNTCDTVSDTDYLNRISTMQLAKVPIVLIEAEIDKYIKSLYYNEKDAQDKYRLIAKTDRLFFLSQDDIQMKLGKTVDKWESVLHDSSGQIVDFLVEEHAEDLSKEKPNTCVYPYVCTPMKGFYSNDFKTQQELLIAKAKELADAIKGAGVTSLSIVDDIVSGAGNPQRSFDDNIGKLPLSIQQLTLSATRARDGGNEKLAKQIEIKTKELLDIIEPENIAP